MSASLRHLNGKVVSFSQEPGRQFRVLPLDAGALVSSSPEEVIRCAAEVDPVNWEDRGDIEQLGVGLGSILGGSDEEESYLVLTFENLLVCVAPAHVGACRLSRSVDGGFDVMWPLLHQEPGEDFADEVTEALSTQGFCVVQMFLSADQQKRAVEDAYSCSERLAFTLPHELEVDFTGRNNTTEFRKLPADSPESDATEGIPQLNRQLTTVGCALAPLTVAELGFEAVGSWQTVARLPAKVPTSLGIESLTDEDFEDGVIAAHLDFLKGRKICMLYIIKDAGGSLWLHPKGVAEPLRIPLKKGRLILFRHTHMDFEYRPEGDSLALQSWMMAASEAPEIDKIEAGAADMDYIYGIEGPTMLDSKMAQVVAMCCRVAESVDDKDSYWFSFLIGMDGMLQWPVTRFNEERDYMANWDNISPVSCCRHGSFIPDDLMFGFNSTFFGIEDAEAWTMDITQRQVLEVGYNCLHRADWTKSSLKGKDIGIYLGDIGADWNTLLMECSNTIYDPFYTAVGAHNAVVPARISHIFNTCGPTMTFDTACSSSLVATHHAHMNMINFDAQSLSCDGSLCGAHNTLGVGGFIICTQSRLISDRGRCFTFDKGGDGYARGEGGGYIFVKLSADEGVIAKRLAAMPGSSANQDGKSASLTAPNGPSQQAVMKKSLQMARAEPEQICAVECHGTGTALGDPIETGAIMAVMDAGAEVPLPHTSAKSNIGHLESNAGMAGLQKSICIVNTMAAPPNCQLKSLNPHLDVEGFPALFETELVDMRKNSGYCGVSSFGFGGTNSRADVYMKALVGPRAKLSPDLAKVDYIAVLCPKCSGRMCWRCGQAVHTSAPHTKHYCSLVRDVFANYDFCTNCYDGAYRCGQVLTSGAEEQGSARIYIIGTWDAWTEMTEMEQNEVVEYGAPVLYECGVVLGDTRREQFQIVVDGDRSQTLYPSDVGAGLSARVCGPDNQGQGKKWLIDGRKDGSNAGTVYKITLEWGAKIKVHWERAREAIPRVVVYSDYEHTYEMNASWVKGGPWEGRQQMMPVFGEPGSYETEFQMYSNKVNFNFVRDGDTDLVIYPAIPDTVSTWVPIRGPDDKGLENRWVYQGKKKEKLYIKLTVTNAQVTLTVSSPSSPAELRWVSAAEDDDRVYCIIGTFSDWEPKPMIPDERCPGVHRYRLALDTSAYHYQDSRGYFGKEEFQICVDGDFSQRLYPEFDQAPLAEAVLQGPDANGHGKNWLITGRMFSTLDVQVDLNQEDRRMIVSWMEVPADILHGLPRSVRSKALSYAEASEASRMLLERCSEPEMQRKFAEIEEAAGGDHNKHMARLQALMLKTVYADFAPQFGFTNEVEAARWIVASFAIHNERHIMEDAYKIFLLQRNYSSAEIFKRQLEFGVWSKGPYAAPGASPSWGTQDTSKESEIPEERRRDPSSGEFLTFGELFHTFNPGTHDEAMNVCEYWRSQCVRTAIAEMPRNIEVGVTEYRVLQRNLIKKLGIDPSNEMMVSTRREVGSTVFTTGRVWTGKQGAEWVELDRIVEKPGWLLMHGHGFGPPGPMLHAIKPGETPPMVVEVQVPTLGEPGSSPLDELESTVREYRKIVLGTTATIRDAKEWIALVFGFDPSLIIIGAPGSGLLPLTGGDIYSAATIKDDHMLMSKAGFQDGDQVPYCYIGDAEKSFEGKMPTWEGKLGGRKRSSAKSTPSAGQETTGGQKASTTAKARAELSRHFETLGLDVMTPSDGIKRQYRLLALSCHPDKHPDDKEGATMKFQKVKAAYESIRDRLGF